jgi:4'-phosphopantetheinyl transferase
MLVDRASERHHARMTAARAVTFAKLAEPLRDDEIHVWLLPYRRGQGRAPLRVVLASYLGISAEYVGLVDGPHGRPELDIAHDRSLAFNWSHSGEHAVIAVARGIQPGIDLERVRPRSRALELARRFFTAEEAAALAALPEATRGEVFLEYWTAKEAVLKALGRGIAFGLDRLGLARRDGQLQLASFAGEDLGAWQLRPLRLGPSFVAALAWRGGVRRVRVAAIDEATGTGLRTAFRTDADASRPDLDPTARNRPLP